MNGIMKFVDNWNGFWDHVGRFMDNISDPNFWNGMLYWSAVLGGVILLLLSYLTKSQKCIKWMWVLVLAYLLVEVVF